MMKYSRTNNGISLTGQNLVRILIASYFMGVSFGLINGTDATPIFALFLPVNVALAIGCSITLLLAYLVLSGLWLRPMALSLGSLLIVSSFVANVSFTNFAGAGDLWRDITIISALMLTYVQADRSMASRRAIVRWRRRVRKIAPDAFVSPRLMVSYVPSGQDRQAPPAGPDNREYSSSETIQNMFTDGPDEPNLA